MVALAEWIQQDETASDEGGSFASTRLSETDTQPKNRVGDFFGEERECVGDIEPQVVELHLVVLVFVEYDASACYKYLYAHANPVMNLDPSGMFSIAELKVVATIRTRLNQLAIPRILQRGERVRRILCRPIDNAIFEAHHFIPLFMDGPGSRRSARGSDLTKGFSFPIDPLAHRGLHGLLSIVFKIYGLPPGNTAASKYFNALRKLKKKPEDGMQVLLWASIVTDVVCNGAKDYKPLRGRLTKAMRKKGYKVRYPVVVGSTLSL